MTCLDENKVVEFIQGLASPEARAQIEAHLDECASCRQLMAEVAKLSFAGSSRTLPPEEPTTDGLRPSAAPGTASVRTPAGGSREVLPEQVLAGRFRIIRRIGRGSFGNVYEAHDLQLDERVALKLLRPEVRDNPGLLGHLHHEIVVGRRVSHPNVCRIYDLGTCGDLHFISMALVPGMGLDRYLEKRLPDVERAHSILVQICEALGAAHHQGVVHRDLKPSNIMVQEVGETDAAITVMDFGLSRDLRAGPSMSGALIGSPAYWSPEQARGDRATARSDIYSLGLIGCDLFGINHPAFGAVTGLQTLPDAYRPVIERCLAPDPEQRFGSAREVRDALVIASKHARIRRRRIRTFLGTGLAALAGAASVLLLVLLRSPRQVTPPAAAPDRGAAAKVARGARPDRRAPDAPGRALAVAPRPDSGRRGSLPVKAPRPTGGRKGSKSVAVVEGTPPPKELAPDAALPPKPSARPALQERLARFEAARKKRGVLIDDLPGGRAQRETAKGVSSAGDEAAAAAALARLEESLRQTKIDGTFVSRKLQRLNQAKGALRLPEEAEKKVAAISREVHDRFFSGDYEGANTQLNSIWRLLGRGD